LAVKNRPVRPPSERTNPFLKQEYKHLLTDPIFLIGNGNSRKDFDLERLRNIGTIVGCNALYRDFSPDLLVAIDAKMLTEISKANYCNSNLCLIPGKRQVKLANAIMWRTERFNTSGCFAMRAISQLMKPSTCYMLGMDSYPGNIYDNTLNYKPNTLQNFSGVSNYYIQTLEGPGDTIYINVNEKDVWPKKAHETGKYKFINYTEFEKVLCAIE
jgi:hypothetical protein